MEINQKHAFWEALVIAIFIFGIGILLGLFIENSRQERISESYLVSEINMLDVKLQTELLGLESLDCDLVIEKNLQFADKVFQDALLLKRYEDASRITDSLKDQHKRYDILRTLLWFNSIKIKQRCPNKVHTIVYLYDYAPLRLEQVSKQEIFSRFLTELKQDRGKNIILIPIAKNMDLASLDLLISNMNIIDTSIIVDEGEIIITEPEEFYKVMDYLK